MLSFAAPPPARAGEDDNAAYLISVSWQFGRTVSVRPRVELSVFPDSEFGAARSLRLPLYRPLRQQAVSLSCPQQGCSKGLLATYGVTCVLGIWGLVEVIEDDL
jgi:hypothetical protein